jgi:hypothetical protein
MLSWLPQRGADAVVRATRRGDWYDVVPPSRTDLLTILRQAGFEADDLTGQVARRSLEAAGTAGRWAGRLPKPVLDAALGVVPTFIVVCRPAGSALRQPSTARR